MKAPASSALLVLAGAVLAGCASPGVSRSDLETTLNQAIGHGSGPAYYFSSQVDLDGDGRAEWVVYLAGPAVCGTGGCSMLVLREGPCGLVTVSNIGPSRPPIRVADTSSNGWRDLVVHVSGGGIVQGYDALLRFDGQGYPDNPTVAPAQQLDQPSAASILVDQFDSFVDGTRLRKEGDF
jgi:hypothetical protein